MSEYAPQLVGILNDGDDIRVVPQDEVRGTIPTLHLRAALGTYHRINLIDLRQKPGPCAFACIDGDFFISIRQWLVAKVIRDTVALMGGLPPLGRPLRDIRVVPQA